MIANFLVRTWTACFLDRQTNIPRLKLKEKTKEFLQLIFTQTLLEKEKNKKKML